MKLTDWIDGDVKPRLKGHYDRKYGPGPGDTADYWNGKRWYYKQGSTACLHQNRPWRGLAEDPNKEAAK